MYKGPYGRSLAALKIQSIWRMHKLMKEYERLKIVIKKVKF